MKKFLLLASVVFAIGYLAAIAAQFAGLISITVSALPGLIGAGLGSGLVGLVLSDYSRRPRFRVRNATAPRAVAPIVASDEDAPTVWTYTTHSV